MELLKVVASRIIISHVKLIRNSDDKIHHNITVHFTSHNHAVFYLTQQLCLPAAAPYWGGGEGEEKLTHA